MIKFRVQAIILLALILAPFLNLQAQEGNGISVSPTRVQRNYKINDSESVNLTLLNNESIPVNVNVNLKSFKLINNNQEIKFELSPEEEVLNWIKDFNNNFTINPKERFNYSLNLEIDPGTKPGGYLFSLLFEIRTDSSNEGESSTKIIQSVGVPFVINVSGITGASYGQISLDSFNLNYDFISNSIPYSVSVFNNSNQIITPIGVTKLKKNFGFGPEQITKDFNNDARIVSSFSIRNFIDKINLDQSVLGEYEVSINFLYGLENNVYTSKTKIFILPLWVIGLLIFIIVLVIFKLKRR